jgi:hypothetical protein
MGIRRRLFQYFTIAVRPLQIDGFTGPPVAWAAGFNVDRPPQYCVDGSQVMGRERYCPLVLA